MAEGRSPFPDDEVFFGKTRTVREIARSAAYGQDYYSPITPRVGRLNVTNTPSTLAVSSALPDILNGSSQVTEEASNSSQISGLNGTGSVIDLDSENDSVQVLSEDESFLLNEKQVFDSFKYSESENKAHSVDGNLRNIEKFNEPLPSEKSSLYESLPAEKSSLNEPLPSEKLSLYEPLPSEKSSLYESLPSEKSSLNDDDSPTGEKSVNKSLTNEKSSPNKLLTCEMSSLDESPTGEKSSLHISPEQENNSIILLNKSFKQIDINESTSSSHRISSGLMSIEALIAASEQIENSTNSNVNESLSTEQLPKAATNTSIAKDFSLNTISDSVLNFSHGSSLENSSVESGQNQKGSLANAVYEDISYDVDQMLESMAQTEKSPSEALDLHMSVDEIDFQVKGFQQCQEATDISQSTLFGSCSNNSNYTNYYSVCGSEAVPAKKPPSFFSFRQASDDSLLEGVGQINLDVHDENINETSFEAIMQHRQNSFTPSAEQDKKTLQSKEELSASKNQTKLPVPTHIPILKPSKLQVMSKTNNFKWAKSLPKLEKNKPKSTLAISSTESKTKISTPISKIPKFHASSGSKTPQSQKNTLSCEKKLQITKSGLKTPSVGSNQSKSAVKTPSNSSNKNKVTESLSHLKPPVKKLCLSDKKNGNALMDKERFKNVVSPVKAYINKSPALIQRKAQFMKEESKSTGEKIEALGKSPYTHAPELPRTAMKKQAIVQKLTYGNNQENMDPNYSRDTLPPRMFENANAVFMKEPEPPKRHLPKLGDKMMKLIDTPRPKVTYHEGRVNEMPREKGHLVPNIVLTASTPDQPAGNRISVRVVKPTEP